MASKTVVGNEQDRLMKPFLERQQLLLKLISGHGIESTKGLVHEQVCRLGGEGARYADSLLLPSGELLRKTLSVDGRLEAYELQHFMRSTSLFVGVRPQQPRNDADVLFYAQVRKKADTLEDITEGTAQSNGVHRARILAVHGNGAARWLDESIHHLEKRGLSGTGRP